jgi:NAD(P)-dependent dehydrogenase (short-subunit alcohol dehydrogenase family)
LKQILITGVSTGIGFATAEDLLAAGYGVFGSVRSDEDAARVQAALGGRFSPLRFDVTDKEAVQRAAEEVEEALEGQNLAALVNNAGISTAGPLLHMPLEIFRQTLEVNVTGLLNVTQRFAPLLGARRGAPQARGRIVNIGSVSGRVAYPFMGAYAASKHALEALSDALRRELLMYGVDVILIEPGTVRTSLVDKFTAQIDRYLDTDYAPALGKLSQQAEKREESALPVEAVTRVVRRAIESERPKTRYPVPRKRLSGWLLPRWLPDRWLDAFVARQLKLE